MRNRPRGQRIVASTAALVMLAAASGLHAQPIAVPHHSFESPDVSDSPFLAESKIDGWMRSGPSYEIPELGQSGVLDTGVFFNAPADPTYIVGVDGSQMAFIGAQDPANIPTGEPPIAIYQTLDHRYQQGKHYVLTIGVAPASADHGRDPRTDNPNDPDDDAPPAELTFQLYYEHDQQRLTVASAAVLSTQLQQYQVIDFALTSETVGASDPWLGKPIGIEIAPTLGLSGYWNVDNVRLTQVPEPATATLIALAGGVLLCRRRR